MDLEHRYKYYVVEFLEQPYSNIDPCVCVPCSWIKFGRNTDTKVSVAYPSEYLSSTQESVRKNHRFQQEWNFYRAIVKYVSDSFRHAEKYIRTKNNNGLKEIECSKMDSIDSQSVAKRNTRSSMQSVSSNSEVNKPQTKDPLLRNNRNVPIRLSIKRPMPVISIEELFKRSKTSETSEAMRETPNRPNESAENLNKTQLMPSDCLNQEHDCEIVVEKSTIANNTAEKEHPQNNTDNKSPSKSENQSCQVSENSTIYTNCSDPKPEEMDTRKSNKSNETDKPEINCQGGSTSPTAEHSTKSVTQPHDKQTKDSQPDPRFLPFFDYLHPTLIKQKLAKTSNKKSNAIKTPQNLTNQPHSFRQSHEHQCPTDFIHHDSHLQIQNGSNSAKVKINETIYHPTHTKNMQNYPKVSDQSQVPNGPQNKPHLTMNRHNNSQQTCAEIVARYMPPALRQLQYMIGDYSPLTNQALKNQSVTINENHTHQGSRTQEIFDKGSTGVNPTDQRPCSKSAITKVPDALEGNVVHDPVNITVERPHNVTPVIVKGPPCTANNFPILVNESRQLHKPLHKRPFSPVQENHLHLQEIYPETPIQINSVDQNSQPQNIPQNTLYTVQNSPSLSNHSRPLLNCSNGKQVSPVIQDQPYQDPHKPVTLVEKSLTTNHTVTSNCSENNTIKKPSSEHKSNSLNTNQSGEKLSPDHEDTLDQRIPSEKMPVKNVNQVNHVEENTYPESSTEKEKEITVKQNLQISIHDLSDVKLIAEQTLLKVFRNVVEHMQLTIMDNISKESKSIATSKFNETTQQMLKQIDRYFETTNNKKTTEVSVSKSTSDNINQKNSETKKNKRSRRNVKDNNSNDDENYVHNNDDSDSDNDSKITDDGDENDDDGYHEAPKKKRGSKRSFVLPPEYDPQNSRWTLQYQKPSPEAVELVPHSRVYINSFRLANCKRIANDYKTFARLLLTEIFSRKALSVCSLTGARANAFDVHESDIRPGLDEDARSLLLTYVKDYGTKMRWGSFDSHSVVNSIRSKIQEMRAKFGTTS